MFTLDTFRLIKNTYKRFLSLLLIVLIGVAFMMGLMSTPTILRESVDRYYDQQKLHDLQLVSSYGFCEEDIRELKKLDAVKDVFPSKFLDAPVTLSNGTEIIARFEECDRETDGYELLEGRLPAKRDECVAVYNASFDRSVSIGSVLTLADEASLEIRHFTVVGFAKSPSYMTKIHGSSIYKNQDLGIVLYVPSEVFTSEYYSTVYLTLEDADEETSFTKKYEDAVEEKKTEIDYFAGEQESYLRDKLVGEYEKELKKNEDLFLKEKEEGQQKIDEAKKKLDDAYLELLIGKSQLDTSRATLNASKKEVEANEHLLDANEATVNDAIRQVEERSGQSFDTVYGEIQILYNTYIALEGQKGGDYAETMISRFQKEKADNEAQIASYQTERDALDPASENYETEVLRLESEIMILENRNTVLESLIANIESTSGDDNIDVLLAEMDAQVEGGVKKNYLDLTMLKDARDQIASGRRELENAKAQIAAGEESLKEGERKLAQGQRQYDNGVKEYNDGLLAFEEGIEKGESELRKAREELEALPNASWSILTRDYHYTSALYDSTISQMTSIGYALPVIFFLVAALVCLTTMTRLIDEQRSQIGIFRALGFSNRAIAFKYVSYASLAALGGSLIGIFLGQALFPTVIYRTWRLMYDLPEIRVSFPVLPLLASVLSFVLLMMGVTYFVASKTLKEMPASLMRPKAPKNTREVFLEKIPFLWKRLSFTSKITARNLIRYKSRFFMTVLGVAGCTALLVVGFGIKDSISDIIQIQYGQIFNYDYQLSFENDRHLKENLDVLKEDLNNEAVVPFMSYTTRCYLGAEEDTLNVLVIDPREGNEILGLRQRDRKSDLRFSNDGVILSEKFAINHKLKEGDSILIESADGIKREARIAHICEFYFQHYIFMSDSYYSSVFEENVHNTSIAVRSADPESLKADTEDLQEYIATVDFSSLISQFENMIRALDIIIGVIIVTAGSLAFVVLVNLIEVNISERTREIATLKVLGFRPLEVENYLFKEILLLSVIGGFLGMPLGVVEHHFIMNVINMEMMMFGMNIKFFSFAVSFVITIVFTVIVLLFTKRHLRAIRMVESLKSVE